MAGAAARSLFRDLIRGGRSFPVSARRTCDASVRMVTTGGPRATPIVVARAWELTAVDWRAPVRCTRVKFHTIHTYRAHMQDYNVREFVLRRTRESFRLNAALADADAAAALAKVRARGGRKRASAVGAQTRRTATHMSHARPCHAQHPCRAATRWRCCSVNPSLQGFIVRARQ